MDSSLADKVAFFQHLDAMQSESDGDGAYDAEEQIHRETCRKFHDGAFATTKPPSTRPESGAASAIEGSRQTRATSQGLSKSQDVDADSDVEIIKVTPRNTTIPRGGRPKAGETHGMGVDTVPDSVRANEKKPLPASLHRLLRKGIIRQVPPPSDKSPSQSVAKRKKEAKLKLVPENQQIFKGLRFYYIPNDDANGVRRHQIIKAKEHGATWVRTLAEASHIIVDQGLTYKDIEPDLTSDQSASTKIIVNASYPTDCVAYRILLDPDQGKYVRNLKIAEKTGVMEQPNQEMTSPQTSRASPTPKLRRSLRRGQESSSSNQQDSQHEEAREINTESNISAPTLVINDELSQCIGIVQNDSIHQQVPLEEEDETSRDRYLKDDIVDSESESSGDEHVAKKHKTKDETVDQQKTSWQDNFACMKGGTEGGDASNPNARTIEFLQAMADQYERRDHFRCISYRKAITTLSRQDHKITTAKEAVKLPNIGTSLAEKIEEIVADDRLRKLEDAKQQPDDITINIFLKIYGVGISQASKWVAQGYRTLEDLREKAQLTPSQVIGIEHYDDLNKRIPRWEVEALAEVVKKTAAALDASIELIIGGSYRRGSDNSGDIDLIITKQRTKTAQQLLPFLEKLVRRLADQGFLTASLASFSGKTSKGHGSKWHGCCVLPEAVFPKDKGQYQPIWRRIDLLLVPESETGAALIYFTGNDIFNRSIRLLASKKGMRLNQRGLYKDVLRGPGRVKHTDGELVEARDEKKIFELLGVKWREPHERWC